MEVSSPLKSYSHLATYPDLITQFPTTCQSISDVTLKKILMSLRSFIQSDMVTYIQQCRAEVKELEDKVHQVETKMSEYTSSLNTLVDSFTSKQEVITRLQSKLADL